MYTNEMKRAFRSVTCPINFKVKIVDHEHYIAVQADEVEFFRLPDADKRTAVEYMVKVKKALEDNGAIVLLVREAMK